MGIPQGVKNMFFAYMYIPSTIIFFKCYIPLLTILCEVFSQTSCHFEALLNCLFVFLDKRSNDVVINDSSTVVLHRQHAPNEEEALGRGGGREEGGRGERREEERGGMDEKNND